MEDEIRLFKCFLCETYKDVSEMREAVIMDFILPKQICALCREKIKAGGYPESKTDVAK